MTATVSHARWPAMMKLATAVEYCDMSVGAFKREIFAGRLPASVMFGNREHWHKEAIDKALERLAGGETDEVPEYRRRLMGDYGEAA